MDVSVGGQSVGADVADEAGRVAIWRNLAKSRDQAGWTAVRPRKLHVESIGSSPNLSTLAIRLGRTFLPGTSCLERKPVKLVPATSRET